MTATRGRARIADTPASVAIAAAGRAGRDRVAAVDDALRQVVGLLALPPDRQPHRQPDRQGVSLRGLGASGASRALVLADGMPAQRPVRRLGVLGARPASRVERLEVLRGGAADLYGSGALGGVVQLVTRPPASGRGLEAEAIAGGASTFDGTLSARGRARRLGGRGSRPRATRTDGYVPVDEAAPRAPWTPRPRRATSPRRARRAARLRRRPRLRAGPGLRRGPRERHAAADERHAHRRSARSASTGAAPERGRAVAARCGRETQLFHQTFSAVAADRSREDLTRQQRVPADALGLSAQWTRALGSRQRLLRERRPVASRAPPRRSSSRGAPPRARVEAGGDETGRRRSSCRTWSRPTRGSRRRPRCASTRWAQRGGRSTRRRSPTGAPSTTTASRTATSRRSARASASLFRASRRALSLTASGYGAFRAPTLNELYRSFRVGDTLTLANPALEPERLWGGEAGALVMRGPAHAAAHGLLGRGAGRGRERDRRDRARPRHPRAAERGPRRARAASRRRRDLRLGSRTAAHGRVRAHRRARARASRPTPRSRDGACRRCRGSRRRCRRATRRRWRLGAAGAVARAPPTRTTATSWSSIPALQVDLFAGYARVGSGARGVRGRRERARRRDRRGAHARCRASARPG